MKNDSKIVIKMSVLITSVLIILFSFTYAFLNQTVTGTKNQVIHSGNLRLTLNEGNELILNNALPMYDEVGMIQEPFTFTLTNEGNTSVNYILGLVEIDTENKLNPEYVRYGLMKDGIKTIDTLSNLVNNELDSGSISKNQTISYELRLWIDSNVEDENLINGKSLSYRVEVDVKQDTKYKEDILNGTDPVLSDNLVPVTIASDGTVIYANINEPWYSYKKQQWANAVVLEDDVKDYQVGDTIEETDIESYFVWIPRYKYKIFNDETYTGVTTLENRVQTIEVEFETKDTEVSNGTAKDEWLSHPAFQAFDTNGFWVGKFESGYRDASSTAAAQVSTADASMLVVKPNTYSWRNMNIGNMFKTSYEYLKNDESHMMKNTEWGAVAYLSHSLYGVNTEVYINNNSTHLTGCGGDTTSETELAECKNAYGSRLDGIYNQTTTGNISGIFDMSGGAWEYVVGYNSSASTVGGNSGITSLYSDFFNNDEWDKYYDKYANSADTYTFYGARILGDATGEMGPFSNSSGVYRSSWYGDYAYFVCPSYPWFVRGGVSHDTSLAGMFYFHFDTGGSSAIGSFRVVLSPKVGE